MLWRSNSKIIHIFTRAQQRHIKYHVCIVRTLILSYKIITDRPTSKDFSPILLFHDLLGSKRQWEGLGKTILNTTKRSVVAVDIRNHGDSPHMSSHKYEELAEDILELYEKLSIDQATLVGHSMGGRAAMCLALTEPKKVRGLIVVDISPVSTAKHLTDFFPKVMEFMKSIDFSGIKKIHKARKAAKKQLRSLITDEIMIKTIISNVNITQNKQIGWSCNLEALMKNFDFIATFPPHLKKEKYYGPTLFIGGQFSDYIPPDDLPGIREMFPTAVINYISKTGHNVHVDAPKHFLEFAIAFLKTYE